MPTVTIMIGLPKSGKSTYIKRYLASAVVVSADHFFMDVDGTYRFDPQLLGEAHQACFRNFMAALMKGLDVVVDNTNTQNWERAPYVMAALAYGHRLQWVHVAAEADVCCARSDNGHGVPEKVIRNLESYFEAPLPFWPGVETMKVMHPKDLAVIDCGDGHDHRCVHCGAPDTCECGPRPIRIACVDCGDVEMDDSAPEPSAVLAATERPPEDSQEDVFSSDCPSCGGSGGGEGALRCPACSGLGRVSLFAPEYTELD